LPSSKAKKGKSNRKRTPTTIPTSKINYTLGCCDYQIAVSAEVWEQIKQYKEKVGAATLGGAIARLLDEVDKSSKQGT
jgi:hypothetical protein